MESYNAKKNGQVLKHNQKWSIYTGVKNPQSVFIQTENIDDYINRYIDNIRQIMNCKKKKKKMIFCYILMQNIC